MLKWSKYNLVFKNESSETMIYNALSNSLLKISADFEEEIPKIQADPSGYQFGKHFFVFLEMKKKLILVNEHDEQDIFNHFKMKKYSEKFDSSSLALTLMVTENCNFCCPYCYEKGKRAADMNELTQQAIVAFVKKNVLLKSLSVTWFGGEPLMRFDIMESLNREFKKMPLIYSSMLVTNGWLLTPEVADKIDELNIHTIQVTIDGPEEIHNKKRMHREYGDSFKVIEENLDYLMLTKKWNGKLLIHYNVDSMNSDCYAETCDYWNKKYSGNVSFGVSFVDKTLRGSCDMGCSFNKEQEIEFYLEQFRKNGGKDLRYYPRRLLLACSATKKNAFVVGADGQLYKCWDDVGKKEMEIGSIHDDVNTWNTKIISRYVTGVEQFDEPGCQECFYLPVCEECPNMWYRKKYSNQDINTCANYKNRLPEFLNMHCEQIKKRKKQENTK